MFYNNEFCIQIFFLKGDVIETMQKIDRQQSVTQRNKDFSYESENLMPQFC